jgi:2,4-dienoyl-CoA reductase-like NADH-dependent reductase (Old Yellow Enzyme family)
MPDVKGHTPLLFPPLTIRGVTMRNRIMASPMCLYMSADGMPTDWHFVHLGRLAFGGTGLVFYEETAVEERGRKTYGCAGLWRDDQIPAFRRIADLIRSVAATPAIQLGHSGGRAASHGAMRDWVPLTEADAADGLPPWKPVSASAIAVTPGRQISHALTQDEIKEVVGHWADAARRSDRAGFDVLEIHGAHGYLIHQFLSPVTNKRNDTYGGDRAGRMRLALEIAEAVRAAWPAHKPLFFRVSSVDGRGGVWDIDDTVALSAELKARGVDAIDCSSGGVSGTSQMPLVPRVPGYHMPFVRRVKKEVGIATIAVGLITEPQQAEDILRSGEADVIAMARELMYHADWPAHAARALGVEDSLALLPPAYAFRLRRREEVAKLAINQPGADLSSGAAKLIEST